MLNGKAKLTERQELFSQHYALSGNGAKAAIASGCRNYGTARERAARWLAKPSIRARIDQIRRKAFAPLRSVLTERLCACALRLLREENYGRKAEGRRAVALINRLGVFSYRKELTREVAELENRIGRPFAEIMAALDQLEDRQNCRAVQEWMQRK